MKIIRRPKATLVGAPGAALTIGNFDGVHVGHQALLRQVSATALQKGLTPTVVTLAPHPREWFNPQFKLPRINTLRDRLLAMQACGIEQVCILPFSQSVAQLSPQAFASNILADQLQARHIWVGDDFRFGAGRTGHFDLLQVLGKTLNFEVHHIPQVTLHNQRVSSSQIREALSQGNLKGASQLLGRPLSYTGRVVYGKQLGRTLGFPTLNLRFSGRASALTGILAVWVHGLEARALPAVASLGVRPTVEESEEIKLEVYVPNWSGNAYGKCVAVEVAHH
ncbi:MAG: bifunctional riboflavin kinase/FAD synthetase [Limnobacter sp.]|nr:bifunctional riboflavin kinase/FAD synthetase [Limnobacter sp.]